MGLIGCPGLSSCHNLQLQPLPLQVAALIRVVSDFCFIYYVLLEDGASVVEYEVLCLVFELGSTLTPSSRRR